MSRDDTKFLIVPTSKRQISGEALHLIYLHAILEMMEVCGFTL